MKRWGWYLPAHSPRNLISSGRKLAKFGGNSRNPISIYLRRSFLSTTSVDQISDYVHSILEFTKYIHSTPYICMEMPRQFVGREQASGISTTIFFTASDHGHCCAAPRPAKNTSYSTSVSLPPQGSSWETIRGSEENSFPNWPITHVRERHAPNSASAEGYLFLLRHRMGDRLGKSTPNSEYKLV